MMTSEELDIMKYKICCPMCDADKCVKNTDKCEAEIWKKKKMETAQMKMIIDIPEKVYGLLKYFEDAAGLNDKKGDNDDVKTALMRATVNGLLLPEHHGRLIDADELIQDIIDDNQLCRFNSESERIFHDKMVDFAIDRIADADTIIKADKESESK